jgi:hypothetical protein
MELIVWTRTDEIYAVAFYIDAFQSNDIRSSCLYMVTEISVRFLEYPTVVFYKTELCSVSFVMLIFHNLHGYLRLSMIIWKD